MRLRALLSPRGASRSPVVAPLPRLRWPPPALDPPRGPFPWLPAVCQARTLPLRGASGRAVRQSAVTNRRRAAQVDVGRCSAGSSGRPAARGRPMGRISTPFRRPAAARTAPTAPRAAGFRRRSAPRRPASATIGRSTWPGSADWRPFPAPEWPARRPATRHRPPLGHLRRPSATPDRPQSASTPAGRVAHSAPQHRRQPDQQPDQPRSALRAGSRMARHAPMGRSALSERPTMGLEPPVGAVSTTRQPRAAPPEGRSALHDVLPVRLHGRVAPCRCPLRATSMCMSASAQPGSRSAARHQRLDSGRCSLRSAWWSTERLRISTGRQLGRPAGSPSAHFPRRRSAQGPPAPPPPPPVSSHRGGRG